MIKAGNLISFLFFSGAKSLVFFTPLAILLLLGDSYYVLVEQTFATSLLLWPILALGMTSAYAYFFLEKKDSKFTRFYYHYLLLILTVIICLFLFSVFFLDNNGDEQNTFLIVFLMCFSNFISITYKCKNDVIRSSILDVLPYIIFFVFLNISVLYGSIGPFLSSVIMILLWSLVFFRVQKEERVFYSFLDVKRFVTKGILSFSVSWIAIFTVTFSRVFVTDFSTLDESKKLYFILRFGMFFVLLYQFLQVKMYSKLFKISAFNLERLLLSSWLFVSVVLASMVLFGATMLYYYIVLYISMWIMVSLLELQVLRYAAQRKVLKRVALCSPIALFFFAINSFSSFLCFSIVLLIVYLVCQISSIHELKMSLRVIVIPVISSVGFLLYI